MIPIWTDVWGLTGAFLLFPLVLMIPGYAIGMATGVLEFKREENRLPKSIILSFAICPWVTYVLYRFTGFVGVSLFLGTSLTAAVLYALPDARKTIKAIRHTLSIKRVLAALAAFLFMTWLLVDLQDGDRLLRPIMAHDYAEHVSTTDAITRTGVPPVNPHFYPGQSLSLFFYYFWFLLCSIIDTIGGPWIGPRDAMLASVTWAGIALINVVYLCLQMLGPRLLLGLHRQNYVLGLSLLLVTGLDIIPILLRGVTQFVSDSRIIPALLFAWNDHIPAFYDNVLWSPHHVAGFVASMTAMLIIVKQAPTLHTSTILVVAAALASAAGLSVWVAFVAAFTLLAWFVTTWLRGWKQETRFLLYCGLLGFILAAPYMLELMAANHLSRFPFRLHVRPFAQIDVMLHGLHPALINALNFVLLPANYLVEFGFFACGGFFYLRYRKASSDPLHRSELFILVMMLSSLFVCTFFRSQIANNDLGWRGLIFAQLALLIYSTPLVARLKGNLDHVHLEKGFRIISKSALFLGSILIILALYVARFYSNGLPEEKSLYMRQTYEWINDNLPTSSVIQHNPNDLVEFYNALYGHRQTAVSDQLYGWLYGIRPTLYDSTLKDALSLFQSDTDRTTGVSITHRLGINTFVVKDTDPIWADSTYWINSLPLLYENERSRIYSAPESQ